MTNWIYTLDLSDEAAALDNETLTVQEFRDAAVTGIKAMPFYESGIDGSDWLTAIVEDLEMAEDREDINDAFDEFYDWADTYRVWVDTFGR